MYISIPLQKDTKVHLHLVYNKHMNELNTVTMIQRHMCWLPAINMMRATLKRLQIGPAHGAAQ